MITERLDPAGPDPNQVGLMGDINRFLTKGAGRYGWIDDRIGIPIIGGRCPICNKLISGDLKAWMSHCANVTRTSDNDLHDFMTKDLKAMIRTDMDNSKERTDRLLAVKIAVQDFEEAKLKGNEKEIAQKEFAKEALTASFWVQMKDERDRRETLMKTSQ